VEVQKTRGLFGQVSMVGLPSHGVRESRDRVRAAIQASRFDFPRQAMIINFAPGDLKKEGSFYDLPVAVGILAASGIVPGDALGGYLFLGELGLDGSLRPGPGALSAAVLARDAGMRGVVVPPSSLDEARLVPEIEVLAPIDLRHAARLFGASGVEEPLPVPRRSAGEFVAGDLSARASVTRPSGADRPDFSDVKGQEASKEALVVAAAGGHNLLLIGPPGSGKTMLATRLPTILPGLAISDALEVSRIHSFTRHGLRELITRPPFRAPHHTISYAGLVGGGQIPRPGEISLAHKGILFLDELPEFGRHTLETLRQPMEDGAVTISRAAGREILPARISLIASMNPCPCGFYGDSRCQCICTPRQIQRYMNRISGPILDRLDMHIEVPPVPYAVLQAGSCGLDSNTMARKVAAARKRQAARWQDASVNRHDAAVRRRDTKVHLNAHMHAGEIDSFCKMCAEARSFLEAHMKKFPMSARGYTRILKVARTLADLDGTDDIEPCHVERAVMFRSLDRQIIQPV